MLIVFGSCSKVNESINCSTVYIPPTLNFQVINKSTNADYFFSSSPLLYSVSDLKVFFKNASNRTDSITPPVKNNDTQKYFAFTAPAAKQIDTCFIKIKNFPTDTVIFTVKNTEDSCPQLYIKTVKINKSTAITTTPQMIIQIKK